jgi:uncharacterized protein YndB with AHSA1/START domain
MTTAANNPVASPTQAAWPDGDLVITRVLAAPRALVFRMWTDEAHFARWWAPHGATVPFCRLDARPGGSIRYCHRFHTGDEVWVGGEYRVVQAPARLAFTSHFADAQGNRVDRPGFPAEMIIDITFADHAGGTLMTAHHTGLVRDQGEVQGWTESLERLDALLAQMA